MWSVWCDGEGVQVVISGCGHAVWCDGEGVQVVVSGCGQVVSSCNL